jgi:hypothetical protein
MIKVKSVRIDSGTSFCEVNEELLNLQKILNDRYHGKRITDIPFDNPKS